MIDRELFKWNVTVADESGATQVVEFASYWSPKKDDAAEEVALAAAATAMAEARQRIIPISAERV